MNRTQLPVSIPALMTIFRRHSQQTNFSRAFEQSCGGLIWQPGSKRNWNAKSESSIKHWRFSEHFCPPGYRTLQGYEIAGAWLPSKTVSGDYYDVLTVGQNKIAVCIGDVLGKGMPAALLMANVQSAVKAFAPDARSPAQLCGKVNSILCGNLTKERYI